MSRRNEILDRAGELFSTRGFHATSMRDLAEAVGLQGGSLYAHIASKDELLFEIVNKAADAFLRQAESVPRDLSPEARLRALVRGHLEVIVRELPRAKVFFDEWRFLSDDYQRRIKGRRDAYEAHFREAIAAGIAAGLFPQQDARLASLFVLSALNWVYQWYHPEGPLGLEALSEQYAGLVLAALRNARPEPVAAPREGVAAESP
ncbi:HTH-type transcriptional repressor KstR2 [Calidithermus terrae]|uniref:HTH-type transcriptional repressor KstR2 n=1 Tax=Calidithermus terrae TaxID=1408545 RepID=A0A399EW30_9DEIN|nr:TetR/AcrR family transcriptional regulator [Calidithermus terrae]RIH88764.1 HTH-type transcriptional repressor KstR2 [Calidithermus terrae]